MKLFKSSLLCLAAIAVFFNVNIVAPSNYSPKDFAFNRLDKITKYQMFTQGTINGIAIFDIVFPLIQQEMREEDIFNHVKNISPNFNYQGKIESIQAHQDFLIGKITGFVDAIKNQVEMFYALEPGILVIAQEQKPEQAQAKKTTPTEKEEKQPEPRTPLAITDKNIQWAEEEFIIELDFYIMEFRNVLNIFPLLPFITWLKSLYEQYTRNSFAIWAKLLNKSHHNTDDKSRHIAKEEIQFTVDSIQFFITTYIPRILLSQGATGIPVDWNTLKQTFNGFLIYDDKAKFMFAGDPITKLTKKFLLEIVNENLEKMVKNNSIGNVAPAERPASPQSLPKQKPPLVQQAEEERETKEHANQNAKKDILAALELASLLV